MGFDSMKDKASDLIGQHDDKVDEGLEKAGEAVKGRVGGHEEQVDQFVDRAQDATGAGDTTAEGQSGNE